MGDTLIAEIAARISVVEIETEVQTLAGIHGKLSIYMVLTVRLVATIVVCNTGIGRQGVHKQKLLRTLLYVTLRLCEDEIVSFLTTDEDATQTRGVVVTCGVEFSIHARIECTVHIQMGQRVGLSRDHITELPVNTEEPVAVM